MSGLFAGLSAYFIAPAALAFAALMPLIILLYFLKLRRTPVVVSSTLLWIKSMQDLTANAPFQRLRRNLLLLLQLLAIALLILGLARPFARAQGSAGRNVCLLVDRSASMQAIEGAGTRLDEAKARALEIVDGMQRGDKVMLVAFADQAEVLAELTDDTARLRALIRGLAPADTRTRIRDALFLAHSLQSSVPDLHVVLLSDGRVGDLDQLGTREYRLTYVAVGSSRDNAGIVAFSVRDPLEGAGPRQAFVQVHNESEADLETTLTVTLDDAPLAIEPLACPGGAQTEIAFDLPRIDRGVLRAELDVDDALAVDDVAWAVIRPGAEIRTLLVSEPTSATAFYLQRVLAHDARVSLSVTAPGDHAGGDGFDLVILDGVAPQADAMPSGALVILNAVPEALGVTETGVLDRPPILAYDREHPLMRFLNPENVGIARTRLLTLPESARVLMSTTGGPLIADLSRGGQPIALVAFDLSDSDWPLKLSFPLFFQNLLSWVPRSRDAGDATVLAGRPLTLPPSTDHPTAEVTRPDGQTEPVRLDPLRSVYYANTSQTGVYTVRIGSDVEQYAVNLTDATESRIAPASEVQAGPASAAAQVGGVRELREYWRHLVLLALATLALEWWIYSRRAWL